MKTYNKTNSSSKSSSATSKYAYYWSSQSVDNGGNNGATNDITSSSSGGGSTNKNNGRILRTTLGAISITTFIFIWLASLGSPIYGFYWCWYGEQYNTPLFVLLVLTLIAYLPWKNNGPFSKSVKAFARLNTFYYTKCVVIIQNEQSLPKRPRKETTKTEEQKQNEDGQQKQQQRQQQQPILYAVHPHGAFCLGWSVLFCSKIMDVGKVRFCFSPVLFTSPLFRLWSRLTGHPGSASKASMIGYMKKKKTLALPPGGFEEATLTCRNKDRVYIKKRTGFVKLALKHGYTLCPVYCFGENQTYNNIQGLWNYRLWLNKLGLPAIFVFGSWLGPLLPKRDDRGIRIVVGEPIVLPTLSDPSREDVQHWHNKYIAGLIQTFEDHKEEYYSSDIAKTQKLEIW